MTRSRLHRHGFALICLIVTQTVFGQTGFAQTGFAESSEGESANVADSERQIEEVSIIGNTELPKVSFNLPWRLPSVVKRSEAKPPSEIPGMLVPIEPTRLQKHIFFNQHLELAMPDYGN